MVSMNLMSTVSLISMIPWITVMLRISEALNMKSIHCSEDEVMGGFLFILKVYFNNTKKLSAVIVFKNALPPSP
jgi:hypothetical protein